MHVGPGANDHGVDIRIGQQLVPILIDLGDVELVGDALRGLATAVTDTYELDAIDRLQSREMTHAGIVPGSDGADFDRCLSHIVLPMILAMETSIQRTTSTTEKAFDLRDHIPRFQVVVVVEASSMPSCSHHPVTYRRAATPWRAIGDMQR
jgi:hypothetical protein